LKPYLQVLSSLLAMSLTACGGGESELAAANTLFTVTSFYKGSSLVQCQPEASTSAELATLVASLKTAEATVVSSSCGFDNNWVGTTVCGSSTGIILVVKTESISPEVVQKYGLRPLSDLPGAKSAPCN